MKFLCVPCDRPMKLSETRAPDRGSVALVYSCPDCGYEMAMLTNPFETQLVSSLGVKIGGEREGGSAQPEGGKCPFTGMVRELDAVTAAVPPGVRWTAGAEARIAAVPEFVRPMVRTGIEQFARERGFAEIDEDVLHQARQLFGP